MGKLIRLPIAYPNGIDRPKTRGECVDGPRPCPFVSCRHHLAIEVLNVKTGRIRFNLPEDPEDWKETCALDVADRGSLTLEEVGEIVDLSREGVRQIEEAAIKNPMLRSKLAHVFASLVEKAS